MAIRRWAVRPGVDGVVDRDELVAAIMDGEALLHRAGGVLTVVVDRVATDLDGERLTAMAVIEWKDRTDAKPQPEPVSQTTAVAASPVPAAAPAEAAPAVSETAGVSDSPDGLIEADLPEEDLSAVPAGLR